MQSFSQYLSESLSNRPSLYLIDKIPNAANVIGYTFIAGSAVYRVEVNLMWVTTRYRTYRVDFGLVASNVDRNMTADQFKSAFSDFSVPIDYDQTNIGSPFLVMSGVIDGTMKLLKLFKAKAGDRLYLDGNSSKKQRIYDQIADRFVLSGVLRRECSVKLPHYCEYFLATDP